MATIQLVFGQAISLVGTALNLAERYQILNETVDNCKFLFQLLQKLESMPIPRESSAYTIVDEQLTPLVKEVAELFCEFENASLLPGKVEHFLKQKSLTRKLQDLQNKLSLCISTISMQLVKEGNENAEQGKHMGLYCHTK